MTQHGISPGVRAILHAKFGAHVAKLSSASDKVTGVSPSPGVRDSSVEEFEAALTKARASWRATGDQPGLLFTVAASRGVGRNFVRGHEFSSMSYPRYRQVWVVVIVKLLRSRYGLRRNRYQVQVHFAFRPAFLSGPRARSEKPTQTTNNLIEAAELVGSDAQQWRSAYGT